MTDNRSLQIHSCVKVAAAALEARLVAELKPLAMEKVQFQVEIAPVLRQQPD